MDRYLDVNAKLSWAAQFGSSELIAALESNLMALQAEQVERAMRQYTADLLKASPVAVETDPDLAAEGSVKEQEPGKNSVGENIPTRIHRTSTPVLPSDPKPE
jgi:hypothetical protein